MALAIKSNGEAEVIEPVQNTGPDASVPRNPNELKIDTTDKNYEGGFTPTGSVPSPVAKATSQPATGTVGGTGSSGTSSSGSGSNTAASGSEVGTKYAELMGQLGQTYDSKYDEQLADLYNQITQRKPFTYSTEDDMLYQMYQQQYTQQGQQAMRDTMGQTAALTGGYGNSYAQVAGQQTYDAYLQELNNLIPELQDAAYQRYAAEGDRLMQMYGLLGDMDARDMEQFKLNQSVNQGTYDRYMNEAALRGAAGDFGGYADLFGTETADKMAQTFNIDRLLPLFEAGIIKKDQFNQLLAPYLAELGIVMPTAAGGGGSPWDYGGSGWNPGYMPGTSGGAQERPNAADSSAYWSNAWDQYNS